ncbi:MULTISPECIES: polysaccharide biosynthesis/export family protein [Empedobacter]|uniref:Sugar transporter n=1 Tax=Empedobacter falsenii TaxID=343874 RepID=A0A427BSR5_9FLAO|nr:MULTISPECIES: polysaccharide biosynthesis/export family protein [Empedobacter]MDM1137810.1 polysaccharide biosynthesis/export family protein [Empedobacter sp. R132-2]RRT94064.1 sugar transporter [Empedobacter falsenii]RRT94258.1 sugar transporter [Empedobacter falsenii]
MKNKIFNLLIVIVILTISSCASKKELVYFQGDQQSTTKYEEYIPKIQSSDMLAISVSAADIKATEPFNQQSVYQVNSGVQNNPYAKVYTVDENGYINYPLIGNVKVGGLTRTEAENELKAKISKYIVNPGVNINFTNFRISVLGEVAKPGNFTIPSERVSILDALGMAGDLTINGVRNNIMVIREQNGQKQTYNVDLTSKEILNSPVYYLAQNDVIYVEPNNAKISSSKFTPNYSLWISVAGVIISVIAVISK